MLVFNITTIEASINLESAVSEIEQGFKYYSSRQTTTPPVGYLGLPKGDCHIKYGLIDNDEIFVVKLASSFYANPSKGITSSSGLMIVLSS